MPRLEEPAGAPLTRVMEVALQVARSCNLGHRLAGLQAGQNGGLVCLHLAGARHVIGGLGRIEHDNAVFIGQHNVAGAHGHAAAIDGDVHFAAQSTRLRGYGRAAPAPDREICGEYSGPVRDEAVDHGTDNTTGLRSSGGHRTPAGVAEITTAVDHDHLAGSRPGQGFDQRGAVISRHPDRQCRAEHTRLQIQTLNRRRHETGFKENSQCRGFDVREIACCRHYPVLTSRRFWQGSRRSGQRANSRRL